MTRYTGTLLGGGIESNLGYGTDSRGTPGERSLRSRTKRERPGNLWERYPGAVGSETEREKP